MKIKHEINSEKPAQYSAENIPDMAAKLRRENNAIKKALKILDSRIIRGDAMTSPDNVKNYLKLALATEQSEVFACLFLDTRNRVISFEKLFFGTIDGASVYPREVVKAALKNNAAAVILSHNHPSGITEPSSADVQITKRLKESLSLIDVRVLDHIIVGEDCTSFAERGII